MHAPDSEFIWIFVTFSIKLGFFFENPKDIFLLKIFKLYKLYHGILDILLVNLKKFQDNLRTNKVYFSKKDTLRHQDI